MATTPRLTDAQLATLRVLKEQGYASGTVFRAHEVFGRHNNIDNGHRRALAGLCRAGVLENAAGQQGVPAWESSAYLVHDRTYQALEQTQERTRDHGMSW